MECKWLPSFYPAPDWNNYAIYENKLYAYFRQLYLSKPIRFQNSIVKYRHKPYYNGREEVFYHLTCKRYNIDEERNPDAERIIRISWTKAIIENYLCPNLCCADKPLYWVKENKHKILFHDFLVIIEERQNYFLLITGFYIQEEYYLRGVKKEAQRYIAKSAT